MTHDNRDHTGSASVGLCYEIVDSDESGYQLKPHTCPVCSGRGLVLANFYEAKQVGEPAHLQPGVSPPVGVPEQCRTCHGVGAMWG